MDVELLTVFNALINLRDNLDARPHILGSELDFLSFATRMAPYSNAQLLQDLWVLYELQEKRNGYFVEFGPATRRQPQQHAPAGEDLRLAGRPR